jgi:hypothetical protein
LAICLTGVLLAGGCAGRIIDLQVVNRTQQTQEIEVDGWGVYNEVIGRPGPGESAQYTLRVAGCRLPQEYTIDAGEKRGVLKVDAFTPDEVTYEVTPDGVRRLSDDE